MWRTSMPLTNVPTGLVAVGSPRAPAVALVGAPVGFSPLQLPGLKLWLDASQITGLVDGDPVATWSDLSGNGNHATQATGSKKPTIQTVTVNGRTFRVVRTDGVDDYLATLAFSVALSQPTTHFLVVSVRAGSVSADGLITDGIATSNRQSFVASNLNPDRFVLFAGTGTPTIGPLVDASFRVLTAIFNGNSSIIRDAGSATAQSGAGTNTLTGVTLGLRFDGSTFPSAVDIAAFGVCDGQLSAANLARLERYLGSAYNLAVAA